jgi:NDP-sugar pyrophosphorylase family protein
MIFAAGLGTRFQPWTQSHPKALALVNGRSLLQRNVEYLQNYGIKRVIVNVHHFADQIIQAVEKNHGWGSEILFSHEKEQLLETGGGLWNARALLEEQSRFVILNVDILTNLDLHRLIDFHLAHQCLISLATMQRKSSRQLLRDAHHRLAGWENKATGEIRIAQPAGNGQGNGLQAVAYSGIAVMDSGIFSRMHHRGKFSILETYLDLAPRDIILCFDHTGDKFIDVGKPESVLQAEQLFP